MTGQLKQGFWSENFIGADSRSGAAKMEEDFREICEIWKIGNKSVIEHL